MPFRGCRECQPHHLPFPAWGNDEKQLFGIYQYTWSTFETWGLNIFFLITTVNFFLICSFPSLFKNLAVEPTGVSHIQRLRYVKVNKYYWQRHKFSGKYTWRKTYYLSHIFLNQIIEPPHYLAVVQQAEDTILLYSRYRVTGLIFTMP